MKTLLASLVLAALAAPASAGPDFVTANPRPRPPAASDGGREIAPIDDILLFDFDSHALSRLAQPQLASAAAWMRRNPRFRIVLEGHTDASGYPFYNEDLATRRAAVARDRLMALGVPSDGIMIVVYGEAAARARRATLLRRVVLHATDRRPREIAVASVARKHALGAVWFERGALLTLEGAPRRGLVGAR